MRIAILLIFLLTAIPCRANDFGFKEAADKYAPGIPLFAAILEAISWVESNHNPEAVMRNERITKSGKLAVSYDRTHMQINDHYWKRELDKIDSRLWDQMLADPKVATKVGAWILTQKINKYGFNWNAIAAYNTGRAINLKDCLNAFPSYRQGKGVTQKQLDEAKARVERGRQYATKVFNYLARKGYLPSQTDKSLAWVRQGNATAPAVAHARAVTTALPMKPRINIADYRESGSWRLVQ